MPNKTTFCRELRASASDKQRAMIALVVDERLIDGVTGGRIALHGLADKRLARAVHRLVLRAIREQSNEP